MITHLQREVTFRTEEKLDQPNLEYVTAAFLYSQGNHFYFMNKQSFEEITVDKEIIGDYLKYIREEEMILEMLKILDKVNINELGMRQKLEDEIARFNI